MRKNKLGKYLRTLRESQDRSLRWVEKVSKQRYKEDTERTISNGYLYQLESGNALNPHPSKLKTLSEIYECSYFKLLELAGYLDNESSKELSDSDLMKSFGMLPEKLQKHVLNIVRELTND